MCNGNCDDLGKSLSADGATEVSAHGAAGARANRRGSIESTRAEKVGGQTTVGGGFRQGVVRTAGVEPACLAARDFKSLASTRFATSATRCFFASFSQRIDPAAERDGARSGIGGRRRRVAPDRGPGATISCPFEQSQIRIHSPAERIGNCESGPLSRSLRRTESMTGSSCEQDCLTSLSCVVSPTASSSRACRSTSDRSTETLSRLSSSTRRRRFGAGPVEGLLWDKSALPIESRPHLVEGIRRMPACR